MASERVHADYRAWLLRQPCACQPCIAPVIVHHSTIGETERHEKSRGGRRGKGQRASDASGIAICNRHHSNFHDLRGYFAGWEKQQLRDWQNEQVERLTRLFAMAHPEPIAAVHATGKPDKPTRKSTTSSASSERSRIVRVILARAAERRHLPDQHALLSELAEYVASGGNETGRF